MADVFDLVVIGSGPAGYVAAIRAAQLGMKVCLVEKHSSLGGTCLNVGCIPSKALLESSHKYELLTHGLGAHGIKVSGFEVNIPTMQARKEAVVAKLTGGIGMLMKKNKVVVKNGWGKVISAGKVDVDGEILECSKILLALGSVPVELPFAKFDHDVVIDSTDALSLTKVPEHLIVIGGGVIGLEMGSVWRRLGAKVTVVDMAVRPVAIMDEDLGKEAQKVFEKQGMEFVLGVSVQGVEVKGKKAKVMVKNPDGVVSVLEGDKVLVAVGRKAATSACGLTEAGVAMDSRGVISIDAHYQTTVPGIYAVGDCVPGPMLAHKGEEEGIAAVETMAGQHGHVDLDAIPWVVYTHPELAGVGLTEEQARAKYDGGIKTGKFKFVANGRALAVEETDGFVKVIADAKTDALLGVHIIGHNASELIAEAAVLMAFKASAEDLARCCHAHPTMSEAVKEAAMAVGGWSIHS